MKKLLAATTFAAFALAAQSAAACDWNREASSEAQTVATTATPSEQTQAAQEAAEAVAGLATKPYRLMAQKQPI